MNPTVRLYLRMTRVFEKDGFRFYIRNPPREHGPPHVHVKKADAEVAITVNPGDGDDLVREVYRMRDADVVKAVRLVEANIDLLPKVWRQIHGST
jgi:hypothetical protein